MPKKAPTLRQIIDNLDPGTFRASLSRMHYNLEMVIVYRRNGMHKDAIAALDTIAHDVQHLRNELAPPPVKCNPFTCDSCGWEMDASLSETRTAHEPGCKAFDTEDNDLDKEIVQ